MNLWSLNETMDTRDSHQRGVQNWLLAHFAQKWQMRK